MSEVWEFVRAFREWADLIGLMLAAAFIIATGIWLAYLAIKP